MRRWLALALALGALAAAAAQLVPSQLPSDIASQISQLPGRVNNTVVSPSQCPGIWQERYTAGNCSRSACTTTCLRSLAEVPLSCVPILVDGQIAVDTTVADVFDDTQAILKLCGINVYLNETGAVLTPTSTNINTIVYYLVGICVGAVVTTVLFIILLAAPTLAKRTIDAPTVWIKRSGKAAVAGGKAAARHGKAAASKAKGAMNKTEGKLEAGWDKVKEELHLPSKNNMEGANAPASDSAAPQAAPAGTVSATALDAAAELAAAPPAAVLAVAAAAGEPAPPPASGSSALVPGQPSSVQAVSSASLPTGQPINGTSVSKGQALGARLDSVHLVEIAPSGSARTTYITWLLLATCLYLGALPLLIYGLTQFVNNTVAGATLGNSGNSSALSAIKWLIIGGLIVVGVCDLIAFHIVMTANFPVIYMWHWSLKNWFYSKWVAKHAFRIHVVVAGLVIMVLTIACILFGLGILVVTIQLMVQLVCQTLGNLSIEGVRVQDVCIQLPISGMDEPVCGFQALQGCYDVQSMSVLTLVLGAALLLWSHIIWLVVLLLSMYRFQTWNIQNIDSESAQPLMGDSAAPLAAGASQSVYAGSTVSEAALQGQDGRASEADVAEGAGGGAAAASQRGLMRRVQFWKKSSA